MPNAPLSPDTRAILAAIRQSQEDTKAQIAVLAARVERLEEAFPDSDPAGHRIYHERLIDKRERWDDVKHRLVMHIAGWGALGLIGWIVYVLWEAVKMEVRK